MKKHTCWVALGLTGACTAAIAQASVTLYGLVDANIAHVTGGDRKNGGASVTRLNDGHTYGLNGSRWGIRVSEDLGGGLRAGALLEQGIGVDDGTLKQGGRAFGRQAFVHLSAQGVGELRLGRQYALHDEVNVLHNPFNGGTVLFPGGAGLTNTGNSILPQFIDAPRVDNVVQYLTPNFGGFSAQVAVAPGEALNDRYHGVKAAYLAGPVVLAASYEWNKDRTSGARTNRVFTGAASYDFSAVKLFVGAQQADKLTSSPGNVAGIANWTITGPVRFVADELRGYTVGAAVPVQAWTFGANYTWTRYARAGQSLDLGRVAAGARYSLSKSTQLYAAASVATGDLKEYLLEKRMLQAGVRMAF